MSSEIDISERVRFFTIDKETKEALTLSLPTAAMGKATIKPKAKPLPGAKASEDANWKTF
ncbi:MAG: hypothetical protein FJX65_18845 [Alphaproteobacteria bacterium]|nr:hypothetical protein [Alphaproteobacteria bacterium]